MENRAAEEENILDENGLNENGLDGNGLEENDLKEKGLDEEGLHEEGLDLVDDAADLPTTDADVNTGLTKGDLIDDTAEVPTTDVDVNTGLTKDGRSTSFDKVAKRDSEEKTRSIGIQIGGVRKMKLVDKPKPVAKKSGGSSGGGLGSSSGVGHKEYFEAGMKIKEIDVQMKVIADSVEDLLLQLAVAKQEDDERKIEELKRAIRGEASEFHRKKKRIEGLIRSIKMDEATFFRTYGAITKLSLSTSILNATSSSVGYCGLCLEDNKSSKQIGI